MTKSAKIVALISLLLLFASWFAVTIHSDLPLIFKKDLYAHDESSNSVVAANITRKFFPPMIRVNPLNPVQGNWMEGPFWQHIPPLFAYVPYIFFKLDGRVTIEVKRLSYAFLDLLAGGLFIWIVYKFSKNLWSTLAATTAAMLWTMNPFTRALITGYAFGVSDIVLAFTAVCAFGGLLWYLSEGRQQRVKYLWYRLVPIALLTALPIMAKNLLGAIPGALFFILLLIDHRKLSRQIWIAAGSFLVFLFLYYFPLYLASAATFKKEILIAFFHLQNLEGWARPWHYYVTNYLPQLYLFHYTWVYFIGLILSGWQIFRSKNLERSQKILLRLSFGWFIWNLLVISAVTSKIPNFIYQSFLFSLFAICLTLVIWISKIPWPQILGVKSMSVLLIVAVILTAGSFNLLYAGMRQQRAQAYDYQSEHEKFYQTAEILRDQEHINTNDLIIVHINNDQNSEDCWFRYYPLFLTGTESKSLLEMYFGYSADRVKTQYQRLFFVVDKTEPTPTTGVFATRIELPTYSVLEYDLTKLSTQQIQNLIDGVIGAHAIDIQNDIQRIKKDKTSCQWLVPDPILNAP